MSGAFDDCLSDRFGISLGPAEREHIERARRYAARMGPHEAFSHVTAAVLWDVPLPASVVSQAPIHAAVAAPHRLPRARGVRGHQTVGSATVITREPRYGLAVTDPATTWAMLGSMLKNPHDLIAAGDAVVRTWRVDAPLATIADLERAVSRGRRVGVVALRAALPHVRSGAASRPETRTRLILTDAGLPEPELNVDVWHDGERLAAVDLSYPRLRIGIEYEGEHHLRSPDQWAHDIARYRRLRDAGWIIIQVTKADLFHRPRAVVDQVRAAIAIRSAA